VQFELEVSRKDRAKLALISRTTSNWFKSFNKSEPLTNEGLDIDELVIQEPIESFSHVQRDKKRFVCKRLPSKVVRSRRSNFKIKDSRSPNKVHDPDDPHLDLMVKNLEEMLTKEEDPICDTRTVYQSDELTLLYDDSVGNCVNVKFADGNDPSRDDQSYTQVTMSTRAHLPPLSTRATAKCRNITPGPSSDHDYVSTKLDLGRLRRKDKRVAVTMHKSCTTSVLNLSAIKRFARLSDKLRVLSEKQEAINLKA